MDNDLEDSLFSAFFRELGWFVNNRWGGRLRQNKLDVPFAKLRQPDWRYTPRQEEKILVGLPGAWAAHASCSLAWGYARIVQRHRQD